MTCAASARRPLSRRLGDAVDALVAAFSPQAGLRRRAARAQAELLESRLPRIRNRWLEAGDTTDVRGDRWLASRISATDGLDEDLETTRHRSRELYRNDSIGGAVESRVNHVVGARFEPQARIPDADDLNRQLEAVYADWSLRADPQRLSSFWELLRLADRSWAVDGEALVILSDEGDADAPIPLAVEVVDVDRLSTPADQAQNPRIRLGVEYDARKRIVAYHLRNESPFDSQSAKVTWRRVDASRVLHLFERWFSEQSRGIPWMARVLNRLRDIKDLDEANIIAAQIEASFAAFVETPAGNAYALAEAAASGTDSAGRRLEDIVPGKIQRLNSGEAIKFANPNRSGGNFGQFQELNHRRVAAGIDWPYEMVMKDWSGVSFAGGRLALTDARIDSNVRRRFLREKVCMPVWNRLVDEAVVVGAVDLDPRDYNARRSFYRRHVWMGPGWEYAINPTEEIKAELLAVHGNLKTRAEVVAEKYGHDIEQVDAERARERQRERDLDIVPPDVAQMESTAHAAEAAADAAERDPQPADSEAVPA